MPDAVVLLFDSETDVRICGAWAALADADVSRSMRKPGILPHLTLCVAERFKADRVAADLARVAETAVPFSIGLSWAGLFPETGTGYLTVTPRDALFTLHRQVHDICRPGAESLHAWYRPNDWLPHVTLAFGLDEAGLSAAVGVLAPLGLKLTAEVTEFAVIRGSGDGWTEVLRTPFGREVEGE